MATDEEIIAAGRRLAYAYYIGNGYPREEAERQSNAVTSASGSQWAKQARGFDNSGYALPDQGVVTGRSIDGVSFMRAAEQLLANAKASLEALEKAAEPNRKLIAQWRWAVNALQGVEGYKKGFLPDLKDAGPGSY